MSTFNGSTNWYALALYKLLRAELACHTGVFKIALTTSSHVPDAETHEFASDLTNELSGDGYSRQTVTVTVTQDGLNIILDASNPTFSASGADIVYRNWHLIKDLGGADSANPLVMYGLGTALPSPDDSTIIDGTDGVVQVNDGNGLSIFAAS